MSCESRWSTLGSEGSSQNTTLGNIKTKWLQSDPTPQVSAGRTGIARGPTNTLKSIFVSFVYKATHNKPENKTRTKEKATKHLRILRIFAVPQNDMTVPETTDQHRAWLSAVTVLKRGCFCMPNMSPPVSTASGLTVAPPSELQRLQQTNWRSFRKQIRPKR